MGAEVAFRQSFQEAGQFRRTTRQCFHGIAAVKTIASQFTRQLFDAEKIHLPELFQAPGRQGGGIDGADICIGEQSQAAQIFLRLDPRSQKTRRGRVLHVAPIHDDREIEMVLDQKQHRFLFRQGNTEPVHYCGCSLHRSLDMIARPGALTDVVQQQRYTQQSKLTFFDG